MEIEHLNYYLEFSFSEKTDELESFYSASGFFLQTLESLDKLLSGTIGLEVQFTRKLQNIGSHSYTFYINVDFMQDSQVVLGEEFPLSSFREWCLGVRQVLVEYASERRDDIEGLMAQINEMAKNHGICDSFLYTPLSLKDLEDHVLDFSNALDFLGGGGRIRFYREAIV